MCIVYSTYYQIGTSPEFDSVFTKHECDQGYKTVGRLLVPVRVRHIG